MQACQPMKHHKPRTLIGVTFVVILISYSLFTFYGYLEGPEIVISFPDDGYSTTSSYIAPYGTAEHVHYISLNDRQIYIDEKGVWRETILLKEGPNVLELYGKDRYNREVRELRRVVRIEANPQ